MCDKEMKALQNRCSCFYLRSLPDNHALNMCSLCIQRIKPVAHFPSRAFSNFFNFILVGLDREVYESLFDFMRNRLLIKLLRRWDARKANFLLKKFLVETQNFRLDMFMDISTFIISDMPVSTSKGNFGPRKVELSNYVKMPIFGLGTSHSGGYSQEAVVYALKDCNYRLIDTAKRYGCEEFLQSAIHLCGVPREEIFLTSKLWCTDYGKSSTRKAIQGSMTRLGVDYLDLFMMHWPLCPSNFMHKEKTLEETWRELEILYDEGLCRAIGVSNYNIDDLEKLMDTASVTPHVNQVEFHPFQNPIDLREFCHENKIQMEGYCPLGKGKLLGEKAVIRVAKRCGRTPAQVLIRWSIQNNVVTIPKSTQVKRIKENCEVFDFQLNDDEMDILNSLHDGRRIVDVSSIQEKIDSRLPDGYKLKLVNYESEKINYCHY